MPRDSRNHCAAARAHAHATAPNGLRPDHRNRGLPAKESSASEDDDWVWVPGDKNASLNDSEYLDTEQHADLQRQMNRHQVEKPESFVMITTEELVESGQLYNNLQKQDKIRLFRLNRASMTTKRGLEMQEFQLDRLPPFYTLSYCWGSSQTKTQLRCNNHDLPISPKVLLGIHELFLVDEYVDQWFWIDQICVNQEDLAERSHQIKLFANIYQHHQSIGTVVWLDADFMSVGDCDSAFQLAEQISHLQYNNLYSVHSETLHVPQARRTRILPSDLRRLGLPKYKSPSWACLKHLFANPYFERTWIIQEVFLSKRTPQVVMHGVLRDWSHILWAGNWLSIADGPRAALGVQPTYFHTLASIYKIVYSNRRWEFSSLLLVTHGFLATKPQDEIYGILGLAAENEVTKDGASKALSTVIEPDYSKPWKQVHRDVTRHVLNTSLNLTLLSLLNFNPATAEDDRPSWVPKLCRAAIPIDHYVDESGPIGMRRVRPWNASKDVDFRIKRAPDPNVLRAAAVYVDQILLVASWVHQDFKVLGWLEISLRLLQIQSRKAFEKLFHDFFFTLTYGARRGPQRGRIPRDVDFWSFYWRCFEMDPDFVLEQTKQLQRFGMSPRRCEDLGASPEAIITLEAGLADDTKLFITEGHCIGLGPTHIQDEDEIYVLAGGPSPFVLRSQRSTKVREYPNYSMLGECFLSRWMDGEAVQAESVAWEWLDLR